MPSRNSLKRAAKRVDHTGRLRRLKGIAVGISAVLAMAFWSLVSGAVASAQATPAQATSVTSQPFGDDAGSFFGGTSNPSLGSSSGAQRPMIRSGGS
jgi:hypothetical protein